MRRKQKLKSTRLLEAADLLLRTMLRGGRDGLIPVAPQPRMDALDEFTADELMDAWDFLGRLGMLVDD